MVFSFSFALELDENMSLSSGRKQGVVMGEMGFPPRGGTAGVIPDSLSAVLTVHVVYTTEDHPLPSPREDLPCRLSSCLNDLRNPGSRTLRGEQTLSPGPELSQPLLSQRAWFY